MRACQLLQSSCSARSNRRSGKARKNALQRGQLLIVASAVVTDEPRTRPNVRAQDQFNGAVIKHLHQCPACAGSARFPVLRPAQDDLPFALSLELCTDSISPPYPAVTPASPIGELLYFLRGSGSVEVKLPDQEPWCRNVSAGDSVFAPLHSTSVTGHTLNDDLVGHKSDGDLAFLRVLLPIRYVLEDIDENPRLERECQYAAAQATSHWNMWGTQCLSAVSVACILNNALQRGMPPATDGHVHEGGSRSAATADGYSQGLEGQARAQTPGGRLPLADAMVVERRVLKKSVLDAPSFQLPNQENKIALVLDPHRDRVPFTFGVEVFPEGHVTAHHVHESAHEMFFVLSGSGIGFCNGEWFPIQAGDCVVFKPGSLHGVNADEKMYCLELMLPNESFAEFVRNGTALNAYDDDDSCILAAIGCR